MAEVRDAFLREQLLDRRNRLEAVIGESGETADLVHLLREVDSALTCMEKGTYGLCETCHEPIEQERLIADPLVCYCLDHLSSEQQRALEQDLELASRIQSGLLPKPNLAFEGWEFYYHYEPLGAVSGDYCDVVSTGKDGEGVFFLLGDVSGKGVAASMLMAHIHATFRSLIAMGLPVNRMAEHANRIFCESTLASFFATLVCGKASRAGEIEVCNAGHCPPMVIRGGEVKSIEPTGLPIGMFCEGHYSATTVRLAEGDTLFLFTDGLTEARNRRSVEYGESRLAKLLTNQHSLSPQALARACLDDLKDFLAGALKTDDLTIMVIRRLA